MPQACNFIKIETLAKVFSYEFCETFKNNFFIEHLWCLLLFPQETCSNFTFANFTGKQLCWILFLIKLFKKETPTQGFCCEIFEMFVNSYFEEHLRTTGSNFR